jgi:hypothetical protein
LVYYVISQDEYEPVSDVYYLKYEV